MNEKVLEQIKDMIEMVQRGGQKTSYEDTSVKLTVYKVGEVIRIDYKDKGGIS